MGGSDKPGADQVTFTADQDLARFRAVDLDTNGGLVYAGSGRFVGVTMAAAKQNEGVTVLLPQGIALIEAGAAIPMASSVGSDGQGRAIVGTGLGVATEEALAAGQLISVVMGGGVLA
jgi:hypothetical protein